MAVQVMEIGAIMDLMAHSRGFAAIKLQQETKQPRSHIDRNLRWLKRRGMVEHNGAWMLTEQGMMTYQVAHGREP